MMLLLWTLGLVYGVIMIVKLYLSIHYTQKQHHRTGQFDEKQYTVMQPILSGDPRLQDDLRANLKQTTDLAFVWLVDKEDDEAQRVVQFILQDFNAHHRVTVCLCDKVSQGVNPKSFKLQVGLHYVKTPHLIVLDDDSVLNFDCMRQYHWNNLPEKYLLTGLPYNGEKSNVWSKLLASFVNANAAIVYPTLASIKDNHSINGMFYVLPTQFAKNSALFKVIEDELCDDLAVANQAIKADVPIFQTVLPCHVRTTLHDGGHYIKQMKRWLLFSTIYFRRHLTLNSLLLVILPNVLPIVLLLLALTQGLVAIGSVVGVLLLKAYVVSVYRQRLFRVKEPLTVTGYELLNDFILPFMMLYVIIAPKTIKWRDKYIRVTDGKIRYE